MHRKLASSGVFVAAVLVVGLSGGSAIAVSQLPQSTKTATESHEEILASGRIPESQRESAAIWDAFWADIAPFVDDGDTGIVTDEDGNPTPYASFVTQPEKLHADLYWVGEIPDALSRTIDRHPDVTVQIHDSAYSLAELIAGRDRVSDSAAPAGIKFVTVGPAADATGIVVRAEPSGGDDLSDAEVRAVTQQLEEIAGVPVSLQLMNEGWVLFAAVDSPATSTR